MRVLTKLYMTTYPMAGGVPAFMIQVEKRRQLQSQPMPYRLLAFGLAHGTPCVAVLQSISVWHLNTGMWCCWAVSC